MKKIKISLINIIVPVLMYLLAFIIYPNMTTKSDLIVNKTIEKSTVILTIHYARCTGVIINNENIITVLTAKHCIERNGKIYNKVTTKNNIANKIILSHKKDLALLIFDKKFKNKKPVKLGKKNNLIEKLYHLGYPRNRIISSSGIYDHTLDLGRFLSVPGCSGGGVFNKENELVGILTQGSENDKYSRIVNIKDINIFLKSTNLITSK